MRTTILVLVLVACQGGGKLEVPVRVDPPSAPAHIDPPAPDGGAARIASSVTASRWQVAVGMGYACVRTAGAKLTCWGRGSPDAPTVVAKLADVAGVVTAQAKTCAWTSTGAVYCMDGGPPQRVDGITDAVELATDPDAFTTCARRTSGHVACWSDFDKPGPVHDTAGVTGALEIAVAGSTACIRDATGVACWHTQDPTPTLQRIAAATGATSIFGGRFILAATRAGKPPVAWHEADYKPQRLPTLGTDVTRIAIGGDSACALGHSVQCWDSATAGNVHTIPNVDGALEIAVGFELACARVGDRVACWGTVGMLGGGMPTTTNDPVDVASLTDATHLRADGERTCALRATGRVVCWGTRTATQSDPAPVDAGADDGKFDCSAGIGARCPHGVKRVWSGGHQRGSWTCTKTTHVACTETFFGRHQDTETGPETSFGNLDTARDIRMPSNETDLMCVADASGDVSCFSAFDGADRGQAVDGVTDAIQLAQLGEDTCAVERAGTVKCWNERERTSSGAAVRTVPRITDAVEVVGTDLHACVRHKTGAVSCWGLRSALGDNVDVHQTSPITVPGIAL